MARKFMINFILWPSLVGPSRTALAVKAASTGSIRAQTAASQPTITESLPSSAFAGVPPSGASQSAIPEALSSAASASVEFGSDVEQSMMIRPERPPAIRPCGPRTSASTSADPVTQRKTMSLPAANSAALFTSLAPCLTRSSTGPRLRCPNTETANPFCWRLRAMPWPIRPTPMNPIRSATALPLDCLEGLTFAGHMVAEFDRRIDVLERFDSDAHAANDDIAIAEDATDNRLLDVDALDLVHLHFDRAAADEAALVNDTSVGHRNLGDEPPEPSREQHQCSDNGQHDGDRDPQ